RQKRDFDRNPSTAILKVFAIGFGLGMLIRFLQRSDDRRAEAKIDLQHRPTLDEAKFHLGSLFLPFLWPMFQRARRGYEESAEGLHESVERLKKSDLRKLGRKSAKRVEDWIEDEVLPVVKRSQKKVRKFLS
ncbi:MAG: hypothetical protein QOD99_2476, partial [Chthoniobacter sp.]|nr:hypothetical protein [Chthoniobacter sp.]